MGAIVRGAEPLDMLRLMQMAKRFLDASPVPLPWSYHYVEGRLRSALDDPATYCVRVLVVGDRVEGMIVGQIGFAPFAPVKMATEWALWIEPDKRGSLSNLNQLVASYEEWARAGGCAFAGLLSLGEGRFSTVLKRLKYEPVERHWLKEL